MAGTSSGARAATGATFDAFAAPGTFAAPGAFTPLGSIPESALAARVAAGACFAGVPVFSAVALLVLARAAVVFTVGAIGRFLVIFASWLGPNFTPGKRPRLREPAPA